MYIKAIFFGLASVPPPLLATVCEWVASIPKADAVAEPLFLAPTALCADGLEKIPVAVPGFW